MKLLVVRFDDDVDVTSLPPGKDVSVATTGATIVTVAGTVMATTDMEDPPTIEGIYQITPFEPPVEPTP